MLTRSPLHSPPEDWKNLIAWRQSYSQVRDPLLKMLREAPDTAGKLRALWALHVTGGFDAATGIENLRSPDEWIRAWTIQLAFESQENLERLIREANEKGLEANPDGLQLAQSDPSPLVRLFIASAAQRSRSAEFRAKLVQRLVQHDEDAADHNLPLMYWFAAEPLVADDAAFAETLLRTTKIPKLRPLITRRMTVASKIIAAAQ
jgi:hypothetical protein